MAAAWLSQLSSKTISKGRGNIKECDRVNVFVDLCSNHTQLHCLALHWESCLPVTQLLQINAKDVVRRKLISAYLVSKECYVQFSLFKPWLSDFHFHHHPSPRQASKCIRPPRQLTMLFRSLAATFAAFQLLQHTVFPSFSIFIRQVVSALLLLPLSFPLVPIPKLWQSQFLPVPSQDVPSPIPASSPHLMSLSCLFYSERSYGRLCRKKAPRDMKVTTRKWEAIVHGRLDSSILTYFHNKSLFPIYTPGQKR